MWKSDKALNVLTRARPARIAYLIPTYPSHALLDTLIDESLSRWGGRRTPLIPTDGESISPAYWNFLNLWDADIIYSYVRLSSALEKRLYYSFAPSDIVFHNISEDPFLLRPDYKANFSFVSALSILPQIARFAEVRGEGIPEILDREPSITPGRDMEDSFGFVSNSALDLSLLPYARRISLRSKNQSHVSPRFRNVREIGYIESEASLLELIAERRDLMTVAKLADTLCPHLGFLERFPKRLNRGFP